jgi:hypothetical protein
MEDIRDVFAVSHETAAHRFTNLATHHLDLPVHFSRTDGGGTIYKAYENDGLAFPADASGAIEGQLACREYSSRQVFTAPERYGTYAQYTDTPGGTFFCTAHVQPGSGGEFAVTVGVPFQHAKWFRASPSAAAARPARRRAVAAGHRPISPNAGRDGRGRRPARIPICSPRCHQARSPAWTPLRSMRFSTGTHRRPTHSPTTRPAQPCYLCAAAAVATSRG